MDVSVSHAGKITVEGVKRGRRTQNYGYRNHARACESRRAVARDYVEHVVWRAAVDRDRVDPSSIRHHQANAQRSRRRARRVDRGLSRIRAARRTEVVAVSEFRYIEIALALILGALVVVWIYLRHGRHRMNHLHDKLDQASVQRKDNRDKLDQVADSAEGGRLQVSRQGDEIRHQNTRIMERVQSMLLWFKVKKDSDKDPPP